ncbi:adenylate/guanylate cyclase domain-containing protein [Magnetococcales bacterium HHB-1]
MKGTNLAILFADIAGSTRLYDKLGDVQARTLTSRCIQSLTETTQNFRGKVIKTIGDEVMCVFPTAGDAAHAAVQMQESVKHDSPSWGMPLRVRIGFHFGGVIHEKGDVFGDAVNLAARMVNQAKADQIVMTGDTKKLLERDLQEDIRFLIRTDVKGKALPVELYELTWGEVSELTIIDDRTLSRSADQNWVMELSFQGKTIELNKEFPALSLGRGKNAIMVPDSMASRVHAKIEYRRGKFFVVDQSTNGTYLLFVTGKQNRLHRDELMLVENAKGVLGLGRRVTMDHALAVHFEVKQSG